MKLLHWCRAHWPRIRTTQAWLATKLKVTVRTVGRWVSSLRAGHVTVERGRGPAEYVIRAAAVEKAVDCVDNMSDQNAENVRSKPGRSLVYELKTELEAAAPSPFHDAEQWKTRYESELLAHRMKPNADGDPEIAAMAFRLGAPAEKTAQAVARLTTALAKRGAYSGKQDPHRYFMGALRSELGSFGPRRPLQRAETASGALTGQEVPSGRTQRLA